MLALHGIEPWTSALLARRSNQLSYKAFMIERGIETSMCNFRITCIYAKIHEHYVYNWPVELSYHDIHTLQL